MVKSSNFYSFSSSSSSSDDHPGKRKRHDRKEKDGGELARECGRHRQRHDEDHRTIKKTTQPIKKLVMPIPAALSDYDEFRAHYRFVLPDDDDETIYNDNKNNTTTATNDNNRKKYGSTWQERMVKNYHQGLYKEYVLADLSRVLEIGKIGLRWRTEVEVSNGRGFRYCGNLTCRSVSSTTMTNISTAVGGVAVNGGGGGGGSNKCDAAVIRIQQQQQAEQEAYKTAARRHVGIGVPENGGKEPMGMFLPPPPPLLPPATNATCEDNIDPLEQYIRSCHDNAVGRVRGEDKRANDSDDDDNKKCKRVKNRRRHSSSKEEDYERRRSNHKMQKFSHSRRRRRSKGHSDDDDDDDGREEEQEREERTRLSNVQHGIGLHDYEVDFAYIESGIQKRELVKVRLCLRCAPLLFVARNNSNSSIGSSVVVAAPAMKARLAREDAAMRNRAMLMNGGNNIVIAE